MDLTLAPDTILDCSDIMSEQFLHHGAFPLNSIIFLGCYMTVQGNHHVMFPPAADMTADSPPCLIANDRLCELFVSSGFPHISKQYARESVKIHVETM